ASMRTSCSPISSRSKSASCIRTTWNASSTSAISRPAKGITGQAPKAAASVATPNVVAIIAARNQRRPRGPSERLGTQCRTYGGDSASGDMPGGPLRNRAIIRLLLGSLILRRALVLGFGGNAIALGSPGAQVGGAAALAAERPPRVGGRKLRRLAAARAGHRAPGFRAHRLQKLSSKG